MYGIEFVDTIAVRRIINKGTSTTDKPVLPSEFRGEQNKEKSKELLNLAENPLITHNKGTSKIKLSEMKKPKTMDVTGRCILTGKGTERIKI